MVRNLPAMQETWVQSLGQEDPLAKGLATTPVFLSGEFPGQRSLAGYSPWGCKELDTWATNTYFILMSKDMRPGISLFRGSFLKSNNNHLDLLSTYYILNIVMKVLCILYHWILTVSFGGWNSNCTDSEFSQFAHGYSAELSQVVESEFNHYLLRLNIGSQPQRNVRNVVVARKIKFIINMRTIFFYLVK